MLSSIEARSLEVKTGIWKARAQAKQKRLDRALAEPATSPQQAARRMAWIKRALKMVKRAQSEVEYRTGLLDTYAQHLHALEMALMSGVEQKTTTKNRHPNVG
jgi:hypothetical protein